jgi:crotonobetainyl-CoA:carnitine CoA-transferase CaiB-like acyl-CoA transferase
MRPLENIHVVSLAGRLPGPVAVARLCGLGASATKVEPPEGDPLFQACPEWYRELHQGIEIVALNLKNTAERGRLDGFLRNGDLLLTATRPAGLARLGLGWPELRQRFPRISQVAIVGHARPDEARSGHDLTYQAECGLLDPPHLPRALIADLAGALAVVNAALALILGRERGHGSGYAEVVLADQARDFAEPLRQGLTGAQGLLGGGFPGYNLYRARDGWIAVAALEAHFWHRLAQAVGAASPTGQQMSAFFAARTAGEWEAWGRQHDVPLAVVRAAALEE